MLKPVFTVCILLRKASKEEEGNRFPEGDKILFECIRVPKDPTVLPRLPLGRITHPPIEQFDSEKEAEDYIESRLSRGETDMYTILKTYSQTEE